MWTTLTGSRHRNAFRSTVTAEKLSCNMLFPFSHAMYISLVESMMYNEAGQRLARRGKMLKPKHENITPPTIPNEEMQSAIKSGVKNQAMLLKDGVNCMEK